MSAAVLALLAGGFLGWAGGRLLDTLRETVKLKSARLDAFEVEVARITADQEALGKVHNNNVLGLQKHDLQIAQLAIKVGVRLED